MSGTSRSPVCRCSKHRLPVRSSALRSSSEAAAEKRHPRIGTPLSESSWSMPTAGFAAVHRHPEHWCRSQSDLRSVPVSVHWYPASKCFAAWCSGCQCPAAAVLVRHSAVPSAGGSPQKGCCPDCQTKSANQRSSVHCRLAAVQHRWSEKLHRFAAGCCCRTRSGHRCKRQPRRPYSC